MLLIFNDTFFIWIKKKNDRISKGLSLKNSENKHSNKNNNMALNVSTFVPIFFFIFIYNHAAAAASDNSGARHVTIHNRLADYLQQLQENNFFIRTNDLGEPTGNGTWSDYWELVADSRKQLLAIEIAESLQLSSDEGLLNDDEVEEVTSWPGVREQLDQVEDFNEKSLRSLPGGANKWLSPSAAANLQEADNHEEQQQSTETDLIIATFGKSSEKPPQN